MNGKPSVSNSEQLEKIREQIKQLVKSSFSIGGIGEAVIILGAVEVKITAVTLATGEDYPLEQSLPLDTSTGGNFLILRLDNMPPIPDSEFPPSDDTIGGINWIVNSGNKKESRKAYRLASVGRIST